MIWNLVFQVEFERVQIGNTFINFPFTPYPLQVGLLEHGKVTKWSLGGLHDICAPLSGCWSKWSPWVAHWNWSGTSFNCLARIRMNFQFVKAKPSPCSVPPWPGWRGWEQTSSWRLLCQRLELLQSGFLLSGTRSYTLPGRHKIIFSSRWAQDNQMNINILLRTHSQLSQAVSELARTSYRYMKVSKFFKQGGFYSVHA